MPVIRFCLRMGSFFVIVYVVGYGLQGVVSGMFHKQLEIDNSPGSIMSFVLMSIFGMIFWLLLTVFFPSFRPTQRSH